MNEELQRIANTAEGSAPGLFETRHAPGRTSSQLAGEQAARGEGRMRQRILDRLRESPATLFEVAAHMNVPDHVISGRFTELARDLKIERTGERKSKPESGCACDIWRLSEQ